ncbi:hypothetical protein SAMN05661080_00858 [Modestobacter sp. DSM 44400]|uniref:hypothetical protein n=1 Tax=Modestobacter sp. DSM 44400 TaxID=1550230 RepID=UPI00089DA2FA|nr:hypothetical protein [Modestobacter sp. DSM 44400]SDX70314.1 hypothetical protein SAMN05661080_00858 [Modestobacter sp. DSM 44400]
MSHLISVQLDVLAVLLEELTALGRQLAEEAELCASTGRSLGEALGGVGGLAAGDVGADWTAVVTALAGRTLAVAATVDAALAAYRSADAGLGREIVGGRLVAGAR